MGKAQVLHVKGWWFKPQRLKSTGQSEVFKLIIRSQIRMQKFGRLILT